MRELLREELLNDANSLLHHAMATTSSHELDDKTSLWLIRHDAWMALKMGDAYVTVMDARSTGKKLLGLPVRVTIDDEPDVPFVQLVMEPKLYQKPTKAGERK